MKLKFREVSNCGTYGGFQTHLRLGQDPCEPCREARNAYIREYRRDKGLTKSTLVALDAECPNCGHKITEAPA
jgi:hypothetical protein